MLRRSLLAALVLAAACGPAATEPQDARPAGAILRNEDPGTESTPPADTTPNRGGGTIGSGT